MSFTLCSTNTNCAGVSLNLHSDKSNELNKSKPCTEIFDNAVWWCWITAKFKMADKICIINLLETNNDNEMESLLLNQIKKKKAENKKLY